MAPRPAPQNGGIRDPGGTIIGLDPLPQPINYFKDTTLTQDWVIEFTTWGKQCIPAAIVPPPKRADVLNRLPKSWLLIFSAYYFVDIATLGKIGEWS